LFGVAVSIDNFDTERRIQTKKARYKDIQKWIRDNYDEHVTNLDIANTKRKFGLIQDNHTGIDEYQNQHRPKTRENKIKLIFEALIHFGFIEENINSS
jgi:23S rRNA (uracil1939-C5)-methyltransferase